MKSYSESYKAAGVDVTAGYRAVELMKQHVARTMTPGLCPALVGLAACSSPIWQGRKRRCWYPVPTAWAPNCVWPF